jgi:hypothetical protein
MILLEPPDRQLIAFGMGTSDWLGEISDASSARG